MSKSIAKNFIYNLLLQIVTLFMPLITVPYVSRILGKEGIGIYSYTLSIVQYFVILGTLGVSMYGNRQIAYVRDNKQEMSKTFWSITFLKIITTSISLLAYILLFGFNKTYGYIYLIQAINIIAAMIDISWLYMGLEDFKKTVTRNLFVKILGVVCIFIFVKDYQDLNKYIIINVLMTFIGNLVMWIYIPSTVSNIKIKLTDIVKHIVPTVQLFIPQIAIQIYAVLDKTMLGTLVDAGEVGLYEQSQKIIMLALGLVTSLGVVMLPRMSNTFANGDGKKMNEYLNKSLQAVSYVSIPMAVGLAAVSNEFVSWFFGKDFSPVSYLMIILTPILFFIAISNVLGIQYLLPSSRTKEFTISVTIGAVINVILNFILIPQYKAIGTCIATVVAEFIVTLIQYTYLRKNIKKKNLFKSIVKYTVSSMIMFILVRIIGIYMESKIITTIIQGIVGSITYLILLSLLKEETNLTIIRFIVSKFKKG
ncbi:putative O-antigen transporter [Clostridium pasteurianum DSM 525 = ATCC 6013]|uniref:Polysaccharide biosynthesis protein n=1 Tax=Clostridium pasteurianum DSM 525 = ATCC 6013 TaxID=1262449 RepID=A0A0H3J704_CLOPA|nr:flippase [Clostridium pasteurianum]AJA46760.1 putative O-antigen transporter [Clostridium pasteurianum DSM 525 = ATCC 6013]AJA50748.1 putative O-antigen transporter [Clostridium pasteurianum DSM 525 = ATCC 6013]AOZ74154.1 sugar lyase [Clostridium pasteurianum DSM 525 = ATCC 6013]AOZ77951.1 sugar lyase [Clostridium pasteurianum]ELP58630.1 PST family polysaccharide transporter [Clostridium pasteurianum DSM 525 = ATCC 6013]